MDDSDIYIEIDFKRRRAKYTDSNQWFYPGDQVTDPELQTVLNTLAPLDPSAQSTNAPLTSELASD